jgi:hypothetical protein
MSKDVPDKVEKTGLASAGLPTARGYLYTK